MAAIGSRTGIIRLHADEADRSLINRAAEVLGTSTSDFVLDAATREATAVLLDRCLFQLDARAFKRFAAALDASPSDNPRLRRLLSQRTPWER